jgi:DNA-binding transcriptional regulator GbsR (MarR family)
METETIRKKDNALAKIVETMGVLIEQRGYAAVPGRILSYLLISEPPYRDFYEIQEFMKASKSTISTNLSQLMERGVVNYITFSGDRKRYFQANTKGLLSNIKNRYKEGEFFNEMLGETLQHRKNSEFQHFNRELKEIIHFNTYMLKGVEKLIEDWEKR